MAVEISRRFQAEFPDEHDRYGDAAFDWCVHDNQWLLAWAAEELEFRTGEFAKNVRWLARLLRARDYPSARLRRDLEIAADVAAEQGHDRLAQKLRAGASLPR